MEVSGDYMDAKSFLQAMGEEIAELQAYDCLQLIDYRGCGAYLVIPQNDRLVLRRFGGEFGYCLPWEGYEVGVKYGFEKYFAELGFVMQAHVPASSDLFKKHAANRPSEQHELFLSFESGEDPFEYDGEPDVDGDTDIPLYWDELENYWGNNDETDEEESEVEDD